jgi:hypothetical protein
MEIRLGVIGQAGTGKTELIRALQMLLMQNLIDPGPGLEFASVDHQSAKEMDADFKAHEANVVRESPVRSEEARDFEFALKQGGNTVCRFIYHDAIGQLIDTHDLNEDGRNKENAFIEKITHCNVLWVVMPIRVKYDEVIIDLSKISIIKSYISKAIKDRLKKGISSKISVALVMTRSELVGPEERQETLDMIEVACDSIIEDFKTFIIDHKAIWSSVLFPVSAFGFDNFIEVKIDGGQNDGSQGYYVAGRTYKPWNLSKLLLWSLCAGVQQPTGGLLSGRPGLNSDLASRLTQALSQTKGPAKSVKAGSFSR